MVKLGGRPTPRARAATTCGVALLCAALFGGSAAADPADPAAPPPAGAAVITTPQDLVATQARLQELYQQAEQATERFNATNEQLSRTQTKVNDVNAGIVWAQQNVESTREVIGRIARQQYTSKSMSPMLTLMMSADPEQFLREAPTYAHISQTQVDALARAKEAERQLTAMQKTADSQLAESRRLEQEAAQSKADIEARVAEVEKILAGLTPEQVVQLEQMEALAAEAGQAQLAGIIGQPDQKTTPRAAMAIAFALSKIGLPYIWGGVGPAGYDCSGLTSKAWAHAGVPIRRTSQEQWATLPRVPVADMRPGDLIVYYSGATHIGMYLGNGYMIHAPRTGYTITVAKAGSMPILGVVRPDAGAGTIDAPAIPNVPAPPKTGTRPNPPTTAPGTQSPSPTTPGTQSPKPTTPEPGNSGTPKPGTSAPETPKPGTSAPGTGTPTTGGPTGTPTDPPSGTPSGTASATPTGGADQTGDASASGTPAGTRSGPEDE